MAAIMKWYSWKKKQIYVALLSNKCLWVHSHAIQKHYHFSVFTDLMVKLLQNIFLSSDLHPRFWFRKVCNFDKFICTISSEKESGFFTSKDYSSFSQFFFRQH